MTGTEDGGLTAAEAEDLRSRLAAAEARADEAEKAAEEAADAATSGEAPSRFAAWALTYEKFIEGTVRASKTASRDAAKELGFKPAAFDVRDVSAAAQRKD